MYLIYLSLHGGLPPIRVASLRTLVTHAMRLIFLSLDSCPEIWSSAIVYFMTEKPSLPNMEFHITDVVQKSAIS
jgi:hypothetical protein